MSSILSRSLLVLVLFALFAGASARGTDATSVSDYCAAPIDQEFLGLINKYRAQNGAGPLAMSQTLGAAAEHHALDMAATGTLAHTLSDGTDWLQNIINHGYPFGYRSENIAWGYGSAQAVFDAWKASSGHNATMLNRGFGAIGISRVYNANSRYGYFWVTTFGSQLDTAAVTCSDSAKPTATSVPATATPTKAAPTATATKVPATATPTKVPPTATPTNVPPTATQTSIPPTKVPPTATATDVPESLAPPTQAPPTATVTAVPPTSTPVIETPAGPTQLDVVARPQFVQLSWNDNANNETGYRVYRSIDNGATWTLVADALPANTTRYQDRKPVIQNGRTASYAVVAYNQSGESTASSSEGVSIRPNKSAANGKSEPASGAAGSHRQGSVEMSAQSR